MLIDIMNLKIPKQQVSWLLSGVSNYQEVLDMTETHTAVTCFSNNNGEIMLSLNGIPPYTYEWFKDNVQFYPPNNTHLKYLSYGIYEIKAYDSNNFYKNIFINITQPQEIIISYASQNISCNGGDDGHIKISTLNGVLPLSYKWTKNGSYYSNTQNINNLEVGIYDVEVIDNNNCSSTVSIKITEPDVLIIDETITNIDCYGNCNGSISLSIDGGSPPYSYKWNGPSGFESNNKDIGNLCVGDYNISVKDAYNCSSQRNFHVSQPSKMIIDNNSVNILCPGNNTGSISIEVNGGSPPYSYSWKGPNGFESSSQNIVNLYGGLYILTVTDDNNCREIKKIILSEITTMVFNEIITNPICYRAYGRIDTNVSSNGGTPYTYKWLDNGAYILGETTPIYTSCIPGHNYQCEVTVDNGCVFRSQNWQVTQPSEIIISETHTNPLGGLDNGSITITITNGVSPFTYNWTKDGVNYSTSQNLTNLGDGTYEVTVTDNNSCVVTLSVTLNSM